MSTCTGCGTEMTDDDILSGSDVYAEMASGRDRGDILSSYSGIRYGSSTVFCSECLDSPSECGRCGGTGVEDSDSDSGDDPVACPECDGTGTTKPDILRDSCRF